MRCALVEAAFTKWRLPSSHSRTDANPGVKPLFREVAMATGDPHRCSTSARTEGGRCAHSSRRAVRPCGMGEGCTRTSSRTGGAGLRPQSDVPTLPRPYPRGVDLPGFIGRTKRGWVANGLPDYPMWIAALIDSAALVTAVVVVAQRHAGGMLPAAGLATLALVPLGRRAVGAVRELDL